MECACDTGLTVVLEGDALEATVPNLWLPKEAKQVGKHVLSCIDRSNEPTLLDQLCFAFFCILQRKVTWL